MRLSWLLLVALFSATSLAYSTDAQKLNAFIALPKCGQACTLPIIQKYSFTLSNLTRFTDQLCLNLEAEKAITECCYQNCSYPDLVLAEKSQRILCDGYPRPNLGPILLGITIAFIVLVVLFVGLRCWSRLTISREFWWDDWFLVVAAFFQLVSQGIIIWGWSMGFGLHVWNLDSDLNQSLFMFQYVYEIFYVVVQSTARMSVLLLFYRIFPQQWMRRTIWILIAVLFLHFVIFGGLLIWQCAPLASVYDHTLTGKCADVHAIIMAGAICSIVEDLTCNILPIPAILALHLETSKKLGVLVIMTIGLMASVCSLVRLRWVAHFYYSIDINYVNIPIAILSMIETSLAIICVCFPACKLLLNVYLPRYFAGSTGRGTGHTTVNSSEGTETSKGSLLQRIWSRISSSWSSRSTLLPFSMPWIDEQPPRLSTIGHMSQIDLEKAMNRGDPSSIFEVGSHEMEASDLRR